MNEGIISHIRRVDGHDGVRENIVTHEGHGTGSQLIGTQDTEEEGRMSEYKHED